MAAVTKCDICGKEIDVTPRRYILKEVNVFGEKRRDICSACLGKIKTAIKEGDRDGLQNESYRR